MGKRSVVPFGPQHPVLPEPIHLDLVHGGREGGGGRSLHRLSSTEGLEKPGGEEGFSRVCATWRSGPAASAASCTAWATARAVERIMQVEVPDRGPISCGPSGARCAVCTATCCGWGCWRTRSALRACLCQCWRLREKILDLFEVSTGGRDASSRSTRSAACVKDMDADMLSTLLVALLDEMEQEHA